VAADLGTIKSFILAEIRFKHAFQRRLNLRVLEITGQAPPEEPSQLMIQLTDVFHEMLADTIVGRLVADDRSVPVITPNDLVSLCERLLQLFKEEMDLGDDDTDDVAFYMSQLKAMLEALMAQFNVSTEEQYIRKRKSIQLALELTSERGITFEELFASQELSDEFSRRSSTREAEEQATQTVIGRLASPQAVRDYVQVIVSGAAAEGYPYDEADIADLEQEIKKYFATLEGALSVVAREEIERIWGPVHP
jgi:hypothetical protein